MKSNLFDSWFSPPTGGGEQPATSHPTAPVGMPITGAQRPMEADPTISAPEALPLCFIDGLEALKRELDKIKDAPVIAIDTETTGLDPRLNEVRLIQIATDNNPVLVVDHKKVGKEGVPALGNFLSGPSIKVFHNAKFDLKFILCAGINVSGPIFDTMVAEQLKMAGLQERGFSLAAVVKKYLKVILPKDLQKADYSGEITNEMQQYAVRDAHYTLCLFTILQTELKRLRMTRVANLEFNLIPVLADIELEGILLDQGKIAALKDSLQTSYNALHTQLKALLGNINFNSPLQVKKALATKGILVENTIKATLEAMQIHQEIQTLLQYKKTMKALTSFGTKLPAHIHPITGRIHSEYLQIKSTGRMGSQKPNIQQIPRDKLFRECFVPAPGNKFIVADYSQIELRIAAEISGDPKMIAAFHVKNEAGEYIGDLHTATAMLFSGKTADQISSEDRRLAKAPNFGLIYGMGVLALIQKAKSYNVTWTVEQAEKFKKIFFREYRTLRSWQKAVFAARQRETRTLTGRIRRWGEPPKVTELLNTPIQGTGADMMKAALVRLHNELHGTGAMIVATVHDDLTVECPADKVTLIAELVKRVMEEEGNKILRKVPVITEVKILDSWAK